MKVLLVLSIATLLLVQAIAEASQVQDAENSVSLSTVEERIGGVDMDKKHHPKINCKKACARRCKKASKRKRCMRACKTCCFRCHCVPPGTYGNTNACPCYARLRTHGNRLKCP